MKFKFTNCKYTWLLENAIDVALGYYSSEAWQKDANYIDKKTKKEIWKEAFYIVAENWEEYLQEIERVKKLNKSLRKDVIL